eukprot:TRINITY_DN98345_c0_g1_i1.p1 TRINITY_DN98345_c0_g1~~TRINITY_DN98345_c0_g1_i1.p1  ORF type:complete len:146 (-),score=22.26 TRINITY_DN98345_c0_g1_i1:6-443(-)
MESDILTLITHLHREALVRLARHIGHPIQGCAAGAKQAGLRGLIRRRLQPLDTIKGWTCKITPQRVTSFLCELDAALSESALEQTHEVAHDAMHAQTTLQTEQAAHVDMGSPEDSFPEEPMVSLSCSSTSCCVEARLRALELASL